MKPRSPEKTKDRRNRRADWAGAYCNGPCLQWKPREAFYPSSGKMCKTCWNTRAAKGRAKVEYPAKETT